MKAVKWLFDRIVSFLGLCFLWPVLLVVFVLIRQKMPGGPAFFVQNRIGKDGKVFRMHKFRTMAVAHGGSSVTVEGESRITTLGATLRKYKLDELPELWDVLRGEMSFVGPRPDVPGYADQLQGKDRVVLNLRPGITGPASLKYRKEEAMISSFVRNIKRVKNGEKPESVIQEKYGVAISFDFFKEMSDEQLALWYNDNVIYPDKVRINVYYYHHYSFIRDIEMIVATVLGKRIAYDGEVI